MRLFQADSLIAMIFTGNKTRWVNRRQEPGSYPERCTRRVHAFVALPESMIFTLFIVCHNRLIRRHRKKTHSIEMA